MLTIDKILNNMKPNFQKFLTRKHSVLTDDIIISAWNNNRNFYNLAGVKEYVKNLEVINGDYYFDMNWLEAAERKYRKYKPEFFWRFIDKGYKHGESLKKFSRGLELDQGIKELKNIFWQSVELLNNLLVFTAATHPLSKLVEDKVANILKSKGVKGEAVDEVLIKISRPKKDNSTALEKIDLDKIRKQMKRPRFNSEEALKEHFKKYSFLGYRAPFSKGYSMKFFKERLEEKEGGDKPIQPKINLKFSKKEKEWINLLKEFVYFRTYRAEKLYEALFYLEPLWHKISKHYGMGKNKIGDYRLNETKGLFLHNKKIKFSDIKKRRNGHGFLLYNNKKEFITGAALKKKINFYNKNIVVSATEIKGIVASRGKAKGMAKVVLSASSQSKIKKGDVLVTIMTTPDFMTSMRKAAAFITDEGGITCHAAIVAREMNKPCIIGTKIATKVLHDGDMVEVDADKGIIKKI